MEEVIKKRFFDLAINVYKALEVIQFPHQASDIKRQLLRSSSSSAANYRAACRAKSSSDFLNKLKIVEEESDETLFWLDFLSEIGIELHDSYSLKKETNELLSIIVTSIKTTRNRINRQSNQSKI